MPRRKKFISVGSWNAEATTLLEQLKEQGANVSTAIQQLQTEPIVRLERMDPNMYNEYQRDYRYSCPQRNRNNFFGNKYRRRWRDDDLDVWGPNYDDEDDENDQEQGYGGGYEVNQDAYRRYLGACLNQRNNDTQYDDYNYQEDRQRQNYSFDRPRFYSERNPYPNYNWMHNNNYNYNRGRPRRNPTNYRTSSNNIPVSSEDTNKVEENKKESENEKEANDSSGTQDNVSVAAQPLADSDVLDLSTGKRVESVDEKQPDDIPVQCDSFNVDCTDVPAATVFLDVPMELASDTESEPKSDEPSDFSITLDSIDTGSSYMNLTKQIITNTTIENQGDCDKIIPNINNSDKNLKLCDSVDKNIIESENAIDSINIDTPKIIVQENENSSDSVSKHSEHKLKHKKEELSSKRKSIDSVDTNICKFSKVSDTQKTDSNDSNNNVNKKRINTKQFEPKEKLQNTTKPSTKSRWDVMDTSSSAKTSKLERKNSCGTDQKIAEKKTSKIDTQAVETGSDKGQWESFTNNDKKAPAKIIIRRKTVSTEEETSNDANIEIPPPKLQRETSCESKKTASKKKTTKMFETQLNEKSKKISAKIGTRRKTVSAGEEMRIKLELYKAQQEISNRKSINAELSTPMTSSTNNEESKQVPGKIRGRRKTLASESPRKSRSKSICKAKTIDEPNVTGRFERAKSEGRITRSKSQELGLYCESLPLPREYVKSSRNRSRSRTRSITRTSEPKAKIQRKRGRPPKKVVETDEESDASSVSYMSSSSEKNAAKKKLIKNYKPHVPKIIPSSPVASTKLSDPRLEKYRNMESRNNQYIEIVPNMTIDPQESNKFKSLSSKEASSTQDSQHKSKDTLSKEEKTSLERVDSSNKEQKILKHQQSLEEKKTTVSIQFSSRKFLDAEKQEKNKIDSLNQEPKVITNRESRKSSRESNKERKTTTLSCQKSLILSRHRKSLKLEKQEKNKIDSSNQEPKVITNRESHKSSTESNEERKIATLSRETLILSKHRKLLDAEKQEKNKPESSNQEPKVITNRESKKSSADSNEEKKSATLSQEPSILSRHRKLLDAEKQQRNKTDSSNQESEVITSQESQKSCTESNEEKKTVTSILRRHRKLSDVEKRERNKTDSSNQEPKVITNQESQKSFTESNEEKKTVTSSGEPSILRRHRKLLGVEKRERNKTDSSNQEPKVITNQESQKSSAESNEEKKTATLSREPSSPSRHRKLSEDEKKSRGDSLERELSNRKEKMIMDQQSPRRSSESYEEWDQERNSGMSSSEKKKNLMTVKAFCNELHNLPEKKAQDFAKKLDYLFGVDHSEGDSSSKSPKHEPATVAEDLPKKDSDVSNPSRNSKEHVTPSRPYKRKLSFKGDDSCSSSKKSTLPWDYGLRAVSNLTDERKIHQRRNSTISQENKIPEYKRSASTAQASSCNSTISNSNSSTNTLKNDGSKVNSSNIDLKKSTSERRPSLQHSSSAGNNSPRGDHNDIKTVDNRRSSISAQACNISTDIKNPEEKPSTITTGDKKERQTHIIKTLQRRLSTAESCNDNNVEGALLKPFIDYKMKRRDQNNKPSTSVESTVQTSNNDDNSMTLNVTNDKNENYFVHMADEMTKIVKQQCFASFEVLSDFVQESTLTLEVEMYETKTAHTYKQTKGEKLQKVYVNEKVNVEEACLVKQKVIKPEEIRHIVTNKETDSEIIELLSSDDEIDDPKKTDHIEKVECINNPMIGSTMSNPVNPPVVAVQPPLVNVYLEQSPQLQNIMGQPQLQSSTQESRSTPIQPQIVNPSLGQSPQIQTPILGPPQLQSSTRESRPIPVQQQQNPSFRQSPQLQTPILGQPQLQSSTQESRVTPVQPQLVNPTLGQSPQLQTPILGQPQLQSQALQLSNLTPVQSQLTPQARKGNLVCAERRSTNQANGLVTNNQSIQPQNNASMSTQELPGAPVTMSMPPYINHTTYSQPRNTVPANSNVQNTAPTLSSGFSGANPTNNVQLNNTNNSIPICNAGNQPTLPPLSIHIMAIHNDCAASLAISIASHLQVVDFRNGIFEYYKRLGISEDTINTELSYFMATHKQSQKQLSKKFINYFQTNCINDLNCKLFFRYVDYYINVKFQFKIPARAILQVLLEVAGIMRNDHPSSFTSNFYDNMMFIYFHIVRNQNNAPPPQHVNQMLQQAAPIPPPSHRSGPVMHDSPVIGQSQAFVMLPTQRSQLEAQIKDYRRLCLNTNELVKKSNQKSRRKNKTTVDNGNHTVLHHMLAEPPIRNNEGWRGHPQTTPSTTMQPIVATPAPPLPIPPPPVALPNYSTALQMLNEQTSRIGRSETSNNVQRLEQHAITRQQQQQQQQSHAGPNNINLGAIDRCIPPNVTIPVQQNGEEIRRIVASSTFVPPSNHQVDNNHMQLNVQQLLRQSPAFSVPNDNYRIRLPLSRPLEPPVAISAAVVQGTTLVSSTNRENTVTDDTSNTVENESKSCSSYNSVTPPLVIADSTSEVESQTSNHEEIASIEKPPSPTRFIKCEEIENEVIDVDEWFMNRLRSDEEEEPIVSYNVKLEMINETENDTKQPVTPSDNLPEDQLAVSDHLPPPRIASVDSGFSSPPRQIEHPEIMLDRICICSKKAELVCQCKMAIYCSRECQINNWPNHQEICLRTRKEYS